MSSPAGIAAPRADAKPAGDGHAVAVARYRAESKRSLAQVDAALAAGALEQASQALWDAAAYAVRAAAARRGWPGAAPGDLGQVIIRLIEDEGGSIDLNTNFFIAHSFDRADREWELPVSADGIRHCKGPVIDLLRMLEGMN